MPESPKPARCPDCGKSNGNLVQQPSGAWMCLDCYWEQPAPAPDIPAGTLVEVTTRSGCAIAAFVTDDWTAGTPPTLKPRAERGQANLADRAAFITTAPGTIHARTFYVPGTEEETRPPANHETQRLFTPTNTLPGQLTL